MNKKGFTVIELIVSFSLVMIVVVILLQVVVLVKNLYVNAAIKTELLNKQAIMNRKVSEQFTNKDIKAAVRCGKGCLTFIYEDDSSSNLIITEEENKFSFIDNDTNVINYTTKLISGSSFGEIDITNETINGVADGKNNSIIKINIPVKHTLVEGDFGINIVYQYDSRITAISDIVFDSQNTNDGGTIVLKGSSDLTWSSNLAFLDPGYYVIKSDGQLCTPTVSDSCGVTISGTVGNELNHTYSLTYTFKVDGNVVDQKIRRVLLINDSSNYDFTGDVQMFTAPQTGNYKIELWGAQGGTINASYSGGKGAYTTGELSLVKGDKIYIYVGGQPSDNNGGYNGGGSASAGYAGGGGATDVRLSAGTWNSVDSLKSRIMVAAGGSGGYYNSITTSLSKAGVPGGTINGLETTASGTCVSKGGTQTSGGTCSTSTDVSGKFGIGGNGSGTNATGGGAGYYGGAGRYGLTDASSAGGSGSSFISGHSGCNAINSDGTPSGTSVHYSSKAFTNTAMIAGNASMPAARGSVTVTGNSGNGYARITLVSVTSY